MLNSNKKKEVLGGYNDSFETYLVIENLRDKKTAVNVNNNLKLTLNILELMIERKKIS